MLSIAFAEGILPQTVFAFLLAFARLSSVLMLMPAVGEMSVSPRARIALAVAVTAALGPGVIGTYPSVPNHVFVLLSLVIQEILIGLTLGLIMRLVVSALSVAGSTIAMQTGLGFVQAVDPTNGLQGALIGTFLSLTGLTFILVTNLHVPMFVALQESYRLFPPASPFPMGDVVTLVTNTVADAFLLGIQIATPFLVFGLLFNLAAGILGKLMPQMPIFFIAMPASILFGLVLMMLGIGAAMLWFAEHFQSAIAPLAGVG